jgi:hypothetical protein
MTATEAGANGPTTVFTSIAEKTGWRQIGGPLFRKYVGLFLAVVCIALLSNGLFEIFFSYREHTDSYSGLERKVELRTRELSEALEQQTASSDILRVISGSPTNVQPVFEVWRGNLSAMDARHADRSRHCGSAAQPYIGRDEIWGKHA